jgi:hypothetical protein
MAPATNLPLGGKNLPKTNQAPLASLRHRAITNSLIKDPPFLIS